MLLTKLNYKVVEWKPQTGWGRWRNLTVLALLSIGLGGATAFRSSTKPNIIYIYADDLGYGELGCYGQRLIRTPHLDQLAAEGMRFTQHYASAPVCAPSRCALLTGKHTGHCYIRGNYELGGFEDEKEGGQMPLNPNAYTLGTMLKQVGYQTACVGKWGLGMANTTGSPNAQGFDFFYGYLCQKQAHNFYPTHLWKNNQWDTLRNSFVAVHRRMAPTDENYDYYIGKDYAPDKLTEQASSFIKENKQRPFFLYLSYTLPHLSLQAPVEAVNAYAGVFAEKPYRGENGYASTPYPNATYAAMITYLDQQVGKIRQLLKDTGLDDNTIIMFSSDNGATFVKCVDTKLFNSVGNLRGLKMEVYEGGIRVPMIAYWKGRIKPGQVSEHVSAQYDVMATLAELTKAQSAPDTDGLSFAPSLLGKPQRQHEYLYFEYPENGGQLAVRMGRWKGVKRNLKKQVKAPWELYDLSQDQAEQHDVASQQPMVLQQLDEVVKKAHRPSHIREWTLIDPKFGE